MNASNNDTIMGKSGCPSPSGSDGNNCTSRMMFDKSVEGSIDDLNFNESLDAFLYNENLTDATPSVQSGVPVSDNMNLRNFTMPANTVPGMMTGGEKANSTTCTSVASTAHAPESTTSSTIYPSLPSIPYNIALPSQSVRAASAASASYTTNPSFAPTHLAPQSVNLTPQHYSSMASKPPATTIQAIGARAAQQNEKLSGKRKAMTSFTRPKRMRADATTVSEDDDDRVKRRQGRNIREQQRSQKITQQIDHLREVLASANITFKPDKYSTLVTVAEYIKQLQAKSAALDAEHGKLLSTISKTNEVVNDQYLPASTTGENPPGGASIAGADADDSSDAALVPNIDYRSVFTSCGVPLAVASIDGRFLDCNLEFLKVTGYSKGELLPCHHLTTIPEEVPSSTATQEVDANKNLSLFNLLHRDHMEAVFLAMSEILKRPPRNEGNKPVPGEDCWAGYVYLTRLPKTKMRMNVSLVRGNQGGAKFFDCSLLPVSSEE
ncbi:MAG: hypothetical protein SGBAC_001106 [Bacillariaceae sp.]